MSILLVNYFYSQLDREANVPSASQATFTRPELGESQNRAFTPITSRKRSREEDNTPAESSKVQRYGTTLIVDQREVIGGQRGKHRAKSQMQNQLNRIISFPVQYDTLNISDYCFVSNNRGKFRVFILKNVT